MINILKHHRQIHLSTKKKKKTPFILTLGVRLGEVRILNASIHLEVKSRKDGWSEDRERERIIVYRP